MDIKNITIIEPMNYKHNSLGFGQKNPGLFREELINKNIYSTYEAIKAGLRTATSRGYNTKITCLGQMIKFYSKDFPNEFIIVEVTKLPYPVKSISKEEWSKLEGWDISYFELNPSIYSKYQYQFKYLGTIDKNNNWI